MGDQRFRTLLLSGFAIVALLLAAIGIYGVLAYFVTQRVRELGVRLALGARPSALFVMVVGQGLRPVVAGIDRGPGRRCAALAGLMKSLLFGIEPIDAPTYGVTTACTGGRRGCGMRAARVPRDARGSAGGAREEIEISSRRKRSRRRELFLQQLLLVQLGVEPLLTDQLVVRAAFDDAPFVEDEDDVGVAHGGDPVRDDDRRALPHHAAQPRQNLFFGVGVDGGQRIVQDQDRADR